MPAEIARLPSCRSRVREISANGGEKNPLGERFLENKPQENTPLLLTGEEDGNEIKLQSNSKSLSSFLLIFSSTRFLRVHQVCLWNRSVSPNVFYWGQMLLKQRLTTILPFVLFFFPSRIEAVIFRTRFQLWLVAHFALLWNGQGCPSSLHLRIWIKEKKDYSGRSDQSL